jgi:uracil phosphoribosyltransferase
MCLRLPSEETLEILRAGISFIEPMVVLTPTATYYMIAPFLKRPKGTLKRKDASG